MDTSPSPPPLDAEPLPWLERAGKAWRSLGRLRWLIYGAAALAVVAVLVAGLGYTQRSRVRTLPLVQAVDDWWQELRYPPWDAAQMGDGGPATGLVLLDPMGIDQDEAGNIYVTDRGRGTRGRFVWRIDAAGIAHVVAGDGREGVPKDGEPAVEASLRSPEGVVVGPDRLVYFVDSENHLVHRVEADGTLTRIAGTGEPGYRGDGGPATEARLLRPYDIRFDTDGNLYIADFANHRVRVVTPDGRIATVAGVGLHGYDGDGGPATAAKLDGPYGLAFDAEGRLLIAEGFNNVVRRVEADGTMSTVVGSATKGFGGDGGPATAATLSSPQSVMVDAAGRIFVGDEHNHAIRVVGLGGRIETLAGVGAPGFAVEGSTAAEAPLADPENMLLLEDGSLLVTDGNNG